jgi:predicted RNase H-like HicB family nuclease
MAFHNILNFEKIDINEKIRYTEKKAVFKMKIKCTVIIQKEDDWYVASCVENNVASQGKTMEEAVNNLIEAVALYYEGSETSPEYNPVFVTTLEVAI